MVELSGKIDPGNFIVRSYYMDSLQPKWGGSFEEVEKFQEEVQKEGASAQTASMLEAKIYITRGDVCDNCDGAAHDYAEAARWYRKAADTGFTEDNSNSVIYTP